MSDAERKRREAAAFAEEEQSDAAHTRAELNRKREAMLLAKANGTYNPSSRGDAIRKASKDSKGTRRPRTSDGEWS